MHWENKLNYLDKHSSYLLNLIPKTNTDCNIELEEDESGLGLELDCGEYWDLHPDLNRFILERDIGLYYQDCFEIIKELQLKNLWPMHYNFYGYCPHKFI